MDISLINVILIQFCAIHPPLLCLNLNNKTEWYCLDIYLLSIKKSFSWSRCWSFLIEKKLQRHSTRCSNRYLKETDWSLGQFKSAKLKDKENTLNAPIFFTRLKKERWMHQISTFVGRWSFPYLLNGGVLACLFWRLWFGLYYSNLALCVNNLLTS